MLLSGFDSGSVMPFAAGFGETPTTDGISCLGESSYNKQNENRIKIKISRKQNEIHTWANPTRNDWCPGSKTIAPISSPPYMMLDEFIFPFFLSQVCCLNKIAACLFRISKSSNLKFLKISTVIFELFVRPFWVTLQQILIFQDFSQEFYWNSLITVKISIFHLLSIRKDNFMGL